MKIALLSTTYPFRGGIAQFNTSVFKALKAKGHTVKAFTFSRQYPELLFPGETQYVTDQDQAEAIPSEEILDSINPITYWKTAEEIKKFQPDLVLMKYWISFLAPSLGTVAKLIKKDTKIVTMVDNITPHEPKFYDRPLTTFFLKQNHGFAVMAQAVVDDLKTYIKSPKYMLRAHPLYSHFGDLVDQKKARNQLKLDPEKKTLLFFGFIREYKGLDILIKAFEELDSSYQLLIGGESYGGFEKYQELIDVSSRKEDIIVHRRYIDDGEVPLFFSAADVCVLPYRSATQSGITAIAYHFEVPVISTNVGGLKETIIDGETGIVVEKADTKPIVQAVQRYFNEDLYSPFKTGIKKLKKEMSWERYVEEILRFSESIR